MSNLVQLAIYFPPYAGLKGACTTIADVSKMRGIVWPSKYDAVHTIMLANMERAEAYGHGNKAERRKQRLEDIREAEELCAWYDNQRLTPDDIDAFAKTHEV